MRYLGDQVPSEKREIGICDAQEWKGQIATYQHYGDK